LETDGAALLATLSPGHLRVVERLLVASSDHLLAHAERVRSS
jgi:hypothetical protein